MRTSQSVRIPKNIPIFSFSSILHFVTQCIASRRTQNIHTVSTDPVYVQQIRLSCKTLIACVYERIYAPVNCYQRLSTETRVPLDSVCQLKCIDLDMERTAKLEKRESLKSEGTLMWRRGGIQRKVSDELTEQTQAVSTMAKYTSGSHSCH